MIELLLRAFVTLLGGLVLGLTLAEARFYWLRRQAGEGNPRLLPMMLIRLGAAALIVFAEVALVERLGKDYVTWRVPLALVAFVALGVGLFRMLTLDEEPT